MILGLIRPRFPTGTGFWAPLLRGRRGSGAFTLIELLAVIAIVAVLAALLLPALINAMHKARRMECISRQKQWGTAFITYTDENDGNIPREGYDRTGEVYWNNWAQVQDGISDDVWYNALPKGGHLSSVQPASHYSIPTNRLSFYASRSLFHCPSAPLPRQTRSVNYPIALFSMAMNSQLIEPPDTDTIKFSRIQRASLTPLLLENLLDGEPPVVPQQAQTFRGQPAAFATRFAGRRHQLQGNIIFADGHAESLDGDKVVETRNTWLMGWDIAPPVDVIWTPDPH